MAASKREAFLNLWPPRGRPAPPERPQVRLLSLYPRKLRIVSPRRAAAELAHSAARPFRIETAKLGFDSA